MLSNQPRMTFLFFNNRGESPRNIFKKWHETRIYNMLKNYMVRASGSAGIASRSWLTINWPMNKFNNNREYSYVDEVFTMKMHIHKVILITADSRMDGIATLIMVTLHLGLLQKCNQKYTLITTLSINP